MKDLGASNSARILACFALAAWPALILQSNYVASEPLSMAIGLIAMFCGVRMLRERDCFYALCFGFAVGLACLVRPQAVLIGPLGAALVIARPLAHWRKMRQCVAMLTGLAAVTTPWTVRNLFVLGYPVFVSTNMGDVMYRSNNPLATGNWTSRGLRDSSIAAFGGDELAWNATAAGWAWDWIASNKMQFIELSARKVLLLTGRAVDSTIIQAQLVDAVGPAVAGALVWLANISWMALACTLLVALIRAARTESFGLCHAFVLLAVLPSIASHAIFESQARHNLPILPLLIALAGALHLPNARNHCIGSAGAPGGT